MSDNGIKTIAPPEYGYFGRVLMADGIPIKAHADVTDEAMREAARRIGRLLANVPEVRDNLVAHEAEHHIIAVAHQCSDLPEWRHMKGKPALDRTGTFEMDFDQRVRGMGSLLSSSGEDNLLKLPDERYKDHRDICSHEFVHAIHGYGLTKDVCDLIEQRHKSAVAKGLWPSYAGTNEWEYFAELMMWYFGNNGDPGKIDPAPEPGPEWLLWYDPDGYRLQDDFWNGRIPVGRLSPVLLEPVRSPNGAAREGQTTIIFDNRTDGELVIFRLTGDGGREEAKRVPLGHQHDETCRPGETWAVATPDGIERLFTTAGERCRAVLRDRFTSPEN